LLGTSGVKANKNKNSKKAKAGKRKAAKPAKAAKRTKPAKAAKSKPSKRGAARATGKKSSPKQRGASKKWIEFVAKHGVVLASARGPVPSVAEAVAGEPIVGSWWAHPKGNEIFRVLSELVYSLDVRCFKLVDG
jgi:hypothetical protein